MPRSIFAQSDFQIKKELRSPEVLIRAIDGARTRGLDLGKVARYQLRHYRISLSRRCYLSDKIYNTIKDKDCQMFF